jgi:hypothetical protein
VKPEKDRDPVDRFPAKGTLNSLPVRHRIMDISWALPG